MSITPAALKKLRKRLPRGYQTLVASELKGKYSRSLVGQVAVGARNNDEVLAALIRVAKRQQRKSKRIAKAIATL